VEERTAALHEAITASDEPAVLVAHSAGCITTVVWASRHVGPVHAALLVTPPYIDPLWKPGPDDPPDFASLVAPRTNLPFRTILVASRTDPYTTFEQFEQYAEDWGAELFDAGDAGHIETASGYGPWPAGERLIEDLNKRR
jgi:predicted alpha/beta hydrolase family esterase